MDSDTLDPDLIPLICRICLLNNDDTMFSIHDNDTDEMLFTDKILQCTDVEIKRLDELPDKICEKCVQDLEASYRFRMNVESSDAILQNYLKRFGQVETVTPGASASGQKVKREHEFELIGIDSVDEIDEEEEDQKEPSEIGYQIEEFLEDNIDDHDVEIKYEHEVYAVEHDEELLKKFKSERVKEEPGERRLRRSKGPKPPQICDICGALFTSKTELNAHMRRHLGERPYKCEHCDKAFTISSGLRVHMRTHTGEKPYACQYCDTRFSDFGSRNKHERRHTGERPYVCATCGKTFTYSYVLVNHMMTHTGEKKYECTVCGKRFTKSHHLKQHNNVHLREQGLPYTKYVRKKKAPAEDPSAYIVNTVQSVVTLMSDEIEVHEDGTDLVI